MGTPLKNPPVYLTLAQVQFNPILQLQQFLPKTQESFRQADYPDFQHQRNTSIQITAQDGRPPVPVPVQHEIFLFGNIEKTHQFILTGQSLTLQLTNYDRFEAFSACFLKGLSIVHDAMNLAFTERVGLRYLNRVMPQPDEKIEQYLVDQVLGIHSQHEGQSLYAYTETMNAIGNIKLLSRSAIQEGPLAFPADIQPRNMRIPERFTSYTGNSAILDNDGFVEGRESFSTETVTKHLDDIHQVIDNAFRAATKPHAFTTWNK